MEKENLITRTEIIVNIAFVEAPRQRNSKDENKQVQAGNVPEDWKKPDNTRKLRKKIKRHKNVALSFLDILGNEYSVKTCIVITPKSVTRRCTRYPSYVILNTIKPRFWTQKAKIF